MVGLPEVSGPSGSTPTCHAETTVRRGPRTLIRNLGRPAQPIQLRITQISVTGQELWHSNLTPSSSRPSCSGTPTSTGGALPPSCRLSSNLTREPVGPGRSPSVGGSSKVSVLRAGVQAERRVGDRQRALVARSGPLSTWLLIHGPSTRS